MKNQKENCRLQTAVDYLAEYSGVNGAVVADHEGLIVACSPPSVFKGEFYAALGPEIFKVIDNNIDKLIDPGCRFMSLKTEEKWLTIASILNFFLIVLADKKADDLLNVRIQRTLEMVANHINEKYPAEVYNNEPASVKNENSMEALHV